MTLEPEIFPALEQEIFPAPEMESRLKDNFSSLSEGQGIKIADALRGGDGGEMEFLRMTILLFTDCATGWDLGLKDRPLRDVG